MMAHLSESFQLKSWSVTYIVFPYSEGRRIEALLFSSLALAGLVGIQKHPAAAGFLAALVVLISIFGVIKAYLTPRSIAIDSTTGIVEFSPLSPLIKRFYRPFSIHDYTSVYVQLHRKASFIPYYSVELSNHKGESVLLVRKVPKSQAQASESISNHFGLRNRGLV